ncbi:GNAT family N-acetyltransferase [Planococcus faecalis]|uniref:GNAT family N-acetyltransferase n=1 Tax=Planococcus faecalis TaxID=1598147 RepID=UPI0031832CAD
MNKQKDVLIRKYNEVDFRTIHELNKQQGWNNLVEKKQETQQAWANSTVAVVAEIDGRVVGCLRGLTDGFISLYICELLVNQDHRKLGIGKKMLRYAALCS